MLIYRYDKIKKKIFLSFWEIKKLEDFKKKADSLDFFFYYYSRLPNEALSLIQQILKRGQKERYNFQGNFTSPVNTIEHSKVQLEFLESIYLIKIQRDRSNLDNGTDTIAFTKEMSHFIKSVNLIEKHLKYKSPVMKSAKLSRSERVLLNKVYLSYFYRETFSYGDFKLLSSKGILYSGLTREFIPVLYTPISGNQSIKPENQDTEKWQALEKPARLLHAVTAALYEFYTKLKAPEDLLTYTSDLINEEFLLNINQYLKKPSNSVRFLKHPVIKKYLILFSLLPDESKIIIKTLLFSFKKNLVIPTYKLKRHIIKTWYFKTGELLILSTVENGLSQLIALGLIHESNSYCYIPISFFRKIKKKNCKAAASSNYLIIDSDFHITHYRKTTDPVVMYTLLCIADVKVSDYLLTYKFNPEKMTYANIIGHNVETINNFFLSYAAPRVIDNLKAHIKFLFNHTEVLCKKTLFSLKTPSKEKAKLIEYILNENRIIYQKIFIGGEDLILFNDHITFKKVCALLTEQKIRIIF